MFYTIFYNNVYRAWNFTIAGRKKDENTCQRYKSTIFKKMYSIFGFKKGMKTYHCSIDCVRNILKKRNCINYISMLCALYNWKAYISF